MKFYKMLVVFFMFMITPIVTFGSKDDFSTTSNINNSMKKEGFFSYTVKPNQIIKPSVTIKNHSTKKIKIIVYLNNAHNDNGMINYNYKINDEYKRSNPELKKMIIGKSHKLISIPAKKTKRVSFKIKIPSKGINGVVLGGINTTQKHKSSDNILYSNAILLKENDINNRLKNLDIKNIKPNINQLELEMINNQNSLATGYKFKLSVFNENKDKVISANKNYGMVPNSEESYKLNYENLSPGFYSMKVNLIDKNGRKKTYIKYFSINGKDKSKEYQNYLLIFLLAILITIIYYLGVLLLKRLKNNFRRC